MLILFFWLFFLTHFLDSFPQYILCLSSWKSTFLSSSCLVCIGYQAKWLTLYSKASSGCWIIFFSGLRMSENDLEGSSVEIFIINWFLEALLFHLMLLFYFFWSVFWFLILLSESYNQHTINKSVVMCVVCMYWDWVESSEPVLPNWWTLCQSLCPFQVTPLHRRIKFYNSFLFFFN